jgi:hypothetical protein
MYARPAEHHRLSAFRPSPRLLVTGERNIAERGTLLEVHTLIYPDPYLTNLKGKYRVTIDLLFDWFGISCMTTDKFCFYFQDRLIQTRKTGGQQYNDTSPFCIPCLISGDLCNLKDVPITTKQLNLKLKTLAKQLLGSFFLTFTHPTLFHSNSIVRIFFFCGHTTFKIMTFGKMTLSVRTYSTTSFSITTKILHSA